MITKTMQLDHIGSVISKSYDYDIIISILTKISKKLLSLLKNQFFRAKNISDIRLGYHKILALKNNLSRFII